LTTNYIIRRVNDNRFLHLNWMLLIPEQWVVATRKCVMNLMNQKMKLPTVVSFGTLNEAICLRLFFWICLTVPQTCVTIIWHMTHNQRTFLTHSGCKEVEAYLLLSRAYDRLSHFPRIPFHLLQKRAKKTHPPAQKRSSLEKFLLKFCQMSCSCSEASKRWKHSHIIRCSIKLS
jgi:hypothetical protein